jgi:hypothetical protein
MRRLRHPTRGAAAPARRRAAAGGALAAWLLASACYGYVPTPQPRPDAPVRVELTDAGTVEMAGAVGPGMELVDGRLLSAGADSLVLAVTMTTSRRGAETDWRSERIAIRAAPWPRSACGGSRAAARRRRSPPASPPWWPSAAGFNLGQSAGAGGRQPPAPQ